MKSLQSINKR